jgi:hypothetical protein
MSYPKKSTTKTANVQSGSKLPEAKREKLLAIQEREQLKGLLVTKFLEKYGKEKKVNLDYISKHVTEFMKSEKMTEDNLKKLEQKIREGANIQSQAPSVKGLESPKNQVLTNSEIQAHSQHEHHHHHHHADDDAASVASSQKARSVYAQGDSDDEWATMMKYDTDLYRKEKALEKVREQEQKKKIKDELDRQIEQKRRMQAGEDDEIKRYVNLVGDQVKNYDQKEVKKENDMKNKVMQEKYSRYKQLQEENNRKKFDKKKEKEMDELLVRKIKEELNQEATSIAQKRQQDRENFKKVLEENDEKKKRAVEDARREKEADTKAQQEYTRLIEKQEADRAAEFKAREDRAKQFMNMMADTVVKDQKTHILEEERKQLKQYMDKEARDAEEDMRRHQRLTDQKKDVKKYLDLQMQEKDRKRQEEREVEKKQAQIWKKDTEDFNTHEKKKSEYIKEVNTHHASILKKQIEEENKKHKKMNTQELLLNKPKLREIADNGEEIPFQKQLVNPHRY